MPLGPGERKFLQAIDRIKMYLLAMAIAIFIYLLLTPSNEMQMATSILGLTLCVVFWVTQRLLSLITSLDTELTRALNTLKHCLPKEQQKDFFGSTD